MRAIGIVAMTFLLAGCGLPSTGPRPGGYEGTWVSTSSVRGGFSSLSIVRDGSGWRVRLYAHNDGEQIGEVRHVRCDWNGECTVREGENTRGTMRISLEPQADSEHLLLRSVEDYTSPEPKHIERLDELVLEDGGMKMTSYTIDRAGEHFEGYGRPMRHLKRVSNGVADPPRP